MSLNAHSFGTYKTTPPTLSDGQTSELLLDGRGGQVVSGSVTANAGTNLNTSALATSANQTDGSQKTQVIGIEDNYGFEVENTPMGEMRTVVPTRLVGAQFEGTTVDSNFWLATATAGGTAAQANAELTLATNTTANGAIAVNSVRRARYVSACANSFRGVIQLSAGAANNKRRWGIAWGSTMPTITDGAWFQLDGTTFSIVTYKGSSETKVSSGSFNGVLGTTYAPGTSAATYEIYWTNSKVYFVIGNSVLHSVSASSTTWSNTMNHHIFFDNVNSSDSVTNVSLKCRVASIRRLGPLLTQPTSKYQAGTVAALVCKYGPGNLHGVAVSGVVNNSVVTLYDNTAASGTVLWSSGAMGTNTVPFSIDLKGLPFFTGLTLAITAANSNVSVIYE